MLSHKTSSLEHFVPAVETRSPATLPAPASKSKDVTSSPPIPRRAPGHTNSLRKPPKLRKKHSPTLETLRELRVKESEAALRTAYETQTLAYLTDSIKPFRKPGTPGKSRWSCSDSSELEDILDEEEEFVLAPEHWRSNTPFYITPMNLDWPLPR